MRKYARRFTVGISMPRRRASASRKRAASGRRRRARARLRGLKYFIYSRRDLSAARNITRDASRRAVNFQCLFVLIFFFLFYENVSPLQAKSPSAMPICAYRARLVASLLRYVIRRIGEEARGRKREKSPTLIAYAYFLRV